jgi:hypothetical protein
MRFEGLYLLENRSRPFWLPDDMPPAIHLGQDVILSEWTVPPGRNLFSSAYQQQAHQM